jgi:hypothetical protein
MEINITFQANMQSIMTMFFFANPKTTTLTMKTQMKTIHTKIKSKKCVTRVSTQKKCLQSEKKHPTC